MLLAGRCVTFPHPKRLLCAQYKLFSSALDDTKMHYAVLLQLCPVLPYGKVAVPPTINKCGFTYNRYISMGVECFLKC